MRGPGGVLQTTIIPGSDGTASAPAFRVLSEASGMYLVGAGQLGFSVAGSRTLRTDSTGLQVRNTVVGAVGPELSIFHDKAENGSANDEVGYLAFYGQSSTQVDRLYGYLTAVARVTTNGSEDGHLSLNVLQGGTDRRIMELRASAGGGLIIRNAIAAGAVPALEVRANGAWGANKPFIVTDTDGASQLMSVTGFGALAAAGGISAGSTVTYATTLMRGATQILGAQGASIADPSGGAIQDAEARTAIIAVISRMEAHGLIATV